LEKGHILGSELIGTSINLFAAYKVAYKRKDTRIGSVGCQKSSKCHKNKSELYNVKLVVEPYFSFCPTEIRKLG
jgi:hypothetical protein